MNTYRVGYGGILRCRIKASMMGIDVVEVWGVEASVRRIKGMQEVVDLHARWG